LKTESERVRVHSGYWDDIDNRRKFLFDFAAKMNFDPMKEINWKGMAPKIQAAGVTVSHFFPFSRSNHFQKREAACCGAMAVPRDRFLLIHSLSWERNKVNTP